MHLLFAAIKKAGLALALLVIFLPVIPAGAVPLAGPGDPIDLFWPVSDTSQSQASGLTAGGMPARVVQLNPSGLTAFQKDQTAGLRLPLLSDTVYTVQIQERQVMNTGGTVLSGELAGIADSEVLLSLQDDVLVGWISLPEAASGKPSFYQIAPLGKSDGLYQIEQIDPGDLPEEVPPLVPPQVGEPQMRAAAAPDLDLNGEPVIDVLVIYDAAALSTLGGQAGTLARINQAIVETNLGYTNSQVSQRVSLAGTAQVAYDETSFNWSATLQRLTSPDDGYLDEVHALRNQYNADLVVFLVQDVNYCGLAWVLPPSAAYAPYGFSVVSAVCMSPGVYTFAHEMGHNMGSQHDRANAGASTGAYSYSYGYQDPNRAFRTIMAYNCASGCPRINYWSNPAVSYNGKPTGVADEADTSADNAHSLNNTSGFVSGFRTRQIPVAPSTLSATNTGQSQIDLSWTDNSLNENGFLVWRSEGSDYSLLATLSANTTQYADAGVACGKAYSYKVAATNSVGASEESGPLSASTLPCTRPMAPVSVWAYASSLHSVEVSWSDVPNETNYRVEHSIQGSNVWTQVGSLLPANTTHITDSGLVEKTTYMYRVTALNFAGESTSVTMAQAITDVHPVYLPLAINNP